MGDLYKDDPNSWTTGTRVSKANYEYHYQYPLQKPRIPSTNLKFTSTELNPKPAACNRTSNQKITKGHPTIISYFQSSSDSEEQVDSESEFDETVPAFNRRGVSSTTKMEFTDKFRKVQTVRRRLVVPTHRKKTKTKIDSHSTNLSYLESKSEVQKDSEYESDETVPTSNGTAMSSTAKMVVSDKFRKVKHTVRRQVVVPPHREKTKTKTHSQSTTLSNLESDSHGEMHVDSKSNLNKNVTTSNSRATSSTAKMVITDKFRKVKRTVRRQLVDPRHREKTKTKTDNQPTTPSYLDSNSDGEVHVDSKFDLNKAVTASNSRAASSTAKMIITDKFKKVKQTVRRQLADPPHREKTKTRIDSHSITPSYLDPNSDGELHADSVSDFNKTVTASNNKVKSSTTKMVITKKIKKVKQTVKRQLVGQPQSEKTKTKSYGQPTSPSYLDSKSDVEIQKGSEFDLNKIVTVSNNSATSSTTKTIISDKFRKVKWTVKRRVVDPPEATTPSFVESNSNGEVQAGMKSDLNKNFMASNGKPISLTTKMAISRRFRKVKRTVRRQLVAVPFRKKRETKTDSQSATASSLKPNIDSEVQADLKSDLTKAATPFNSRAISHTTKMVMSSMFKKVKQTVKRRFVAPSYKENTVAKTEKSSSWLKNCLLNKYIDRDMSQVGALNGPNGVVWKPDLFELIRWKTMASRVRSPLCKQANEGKMMVGLESDNEK